MQRSAYLFISHFNCAASSIHVSDSMNDKITPILNEILCLVFDQSQARLRFANESASVFKYFGSNSFNDGLRQLSKCRSCM